MIGSLRGTLLERGEDQLLVEVGGVGYQVVVSPTTALSAGDVGDQTYLWVHHHIREDHQALYGFVSAEEKRCFTALIGAHGVGPALALAILSVHGPTDLARVLAEDDVAALCLVPGVGKKTATRLLVELKSRLDIPLDIGPAGPASSPQTTGSSGARADVREALTNLGYGAEEVRDVLADLPDPPDDDDAGAMLRHALRRLSVPR